MNGCHSSLHPARLKSDFVYHSKGTVKWPNIFTRNCQYIKQKNLDDAGCNNCSEKIKHEILNGRN